MIMLRFQFNRRKFQVFGNDVVIISCFQNNNSVFGFHVNPGGRINGVIAATIMANDIRVGVILTKEIWSQTIDTRISNEGFRSGHKLDGLLGKHWIIRDVG